LIFWIPFNNFYENQISFIPNRKGAGGFLTYSYRDHNKKEMSWWRKCFLKKINEHPHQYLNGCC